MCPRETSAYMKDETSRVFKDYPLLTLRKIRYTYRHPALFNFLYRNSTLEIQKSQPSCLILKSLTLSNKYKFQYRWEKPQLFNTFHICFSVAATTTLQKLISFQRELNWEYKPLNARLLHKTIIKIYYYSDNISFIIPDRFLAMLLSSLQLRMLHEQ